MSYLSDYGRDVGNIYQQLGDAQARARLQQGQGWANALGNIGQAVAAIPGQIQQQKVQAQETQVRQGEIDAQKRAADAAKRAQTDNEILDTAWSVIAKPDGSIDMDKLNQSVPGHLRDTVLSTYDKFQKSQSEAQKTAAEIKNLTAKHELDTRNALGALALGVKAHGEDNPEALRPAYTVAVSTAFKNGTITREQALQALTDMNGDGLMDHLNGLIRQSPEAAKLETDRINADRPFSVDGSLMTRTGQVLGTAPSRQPPPQSSIHPLVVDGKTVPVEFFPSRNPGEPGKFVYNGQDVTGRVTQPPTAAQINISNQTPQGNFDLTGEDFLQTVPKEWRETVRKIANYDEDPNKVTSMRGGMREKVMQWANQVNPEYKTEMYGIRGPVRKAFSIGTQGQQLGAINTAIQHLDLLSQMADQLKNGNFTPGNELSQRFKAMFGSSAPTNYEGIKQFVDGEVSSVVNKGAATVSEMAAQAKNAGVGSSPEQIKGFIDSVIPLMGGKLNTLRFQYHQQMGEKDPFRVVSPEAEAVLSSRGFDWGASKHVSMADLEIIAKNNKTTVEQEKQRATAAGYIIR